MLKNSVGGGGGYAGPFHTIGRVRHRNRYCTRAGSETKDADGALSRNKAKDVAQAARRDRCGGHRRADAGFLFRVLAVSAPPQAAGAQNDQVLKSLGYGDREIDGLRRDGVI